VDTPPAPLAETVSVQLFNHAGRGCYFDLIIGDRLFSYRIESGQSRGMMTLCDDFKLSQIRIDRSARDFSLRPPFLPVELKNTILLLGIDFDCSDKVVGELSPDEIGSLKIE